MPETPGPQEIEPSSRTGRRIDRIVWRLVIFGGLFLLLNGLLYFGQELLAAGSKQEAEAMKATMDELNLEISRLEADAQYGLIDANQEAEFEELVDELDELRPRYEEASKRAYSRWWLLPFPPPGSARE